MKSSQFYANDSFYDQSDIKTREISTIMESPTKHRGTSSIGPSIIPQPETLNLLQTTHPNPKSSSAMKLLNLRDRIYPNAPSLKVPGLRLDRIHATRHFTPIRCRTVTTRHSDHRLVVADLLLPQ